MKNNKTLKLLCSLPIILLALYFIPFLGVCLVMVRCIMDRNTKKLSFDTSLIIIGFIILIPKVVKQILDLTHTSIPYLNDIAQADLYNKFIGYSKLLICVGVIFLIISLIIRNIVNKSQSYIKNYIIEQEKRDAEISQKNDMIIKEKQEKAKNTHVVRCKYCGADNMLTENVGTCKYCRRNIQ